jgi:hypothetical protein
MRIFSRAKTQESVILLFILVFALSGISSGKYSGGTGEPNDPYLIATPNDLNSIGLDPNDWDKHFLMTADINTAGYSYTTALIAPNTSWTSEFQGTPFTGTFDGNGHVIFLLRINGGDNDYLGLFGKLEQGANIINLKIEDANITGDFYLGELCGANYEGVISNCCASGTVSGGFYSSFVGGLCGENYGGIISNCHAEGSVRGNFMPAGFGGLCGYNYKGTINNCYAICSVTGDRGYRMGGLCGQSEEGAINNSYANCYVSGDDVLGGLCGYNMGSINGCYATGDVNGGDYSLWIGGLCGINTATIINCYATGDITGYDEIGGLCGHNYGGVISNCYATGSISGFSSLGGLCGYNEGTVSSSFWDIETSGISNSDGGTGLTTVEMQVRNTFTDASWDMVNIWDIGENQTYPFLRKHLPSDINKDDETNLYDFAIIAEHWLSQ